MKKIILVLHHINPGCTFDYCEIQFSVISIISHYANYVTLNTEFQQVENTHSVLKWMYISFATYKKKKIHNTITQYV